MIQSIRFSCAKIVQSTANHDESYAWRRLCTELSTEFVDTRRQANIHAIFQKSLKQSWDQRPFL